ncbi:MAG: 8-amino-7-oxononanoate synthase, partial [Deltaproteobacteria bacterium]|nr:8-amino-7-oxononanoate synthase [Deltaproteobacteria bacterium]
MDRLGHLDAELSKLRNESLLRLRRDPLPPGTLVLCSNDYLGFAAEPFTADEIQSASGAGASRLIAGDHPE